MWVGSCVVAEKRKEKGGKGKTMKLTKKLLYTSLIMVFLVSLTMINVTSASPDTFSVDPSAVSFPDEVFQIAINVDDALPSYAWEVYVGWDSNLLALVNVAEGDFLDRRFVNPFPPPEYIPLYYTTLAYTPLGEANLAGETIITCSLIGNVPWASGDGWLVTLSFLVMGEGSGDIDVFNTRLWDHMEAGYPAPTDYNDVAVSVETSAPFYDVDLAKWKLKVNGKAGIAGEGGHRTTVGTPNLLEASVKNYGPRDCYVQVYFEIRDSAGVWIATVWSDIVGPLSSGERTTLSATWTAPHPRVYHITANLFYPVLDGFSRTVRLDAFWP